MVLAWGGGQAGLAAEVAGRGAAALDGRVASVTPVRRGGSRAACQLVAELGGMTWRRGKLQCRQFGQRSEMG